MITTRILVIEDEALLAFEMQATLTRAGFTIVGCTGSIETALALVDRQLCDLGVLDINLRGKSVEPVAMALSERGVPFLFVSGHGRGLLPKTLQDAPLLPKPFTREDLVFAVRERLAAGRRQDAPASSR